MPSNRVRRYLGDVFGLSPGAPFWWADVLVSVVGMAMPVVVGGMLGHAPGGLVAAAGAMMVIGLAHRREPLAQLCALAGPLTAIILASAVAASAAGHGWLTDAGIALAAAVGAVFAGFSRFAAVLAANFVVFLVISSAVIAPAGVAGEAAMLVIIGALWASLISVAVSLLMSGESLGDAGPEAEAPSNPTFAAKLARWRRVMSTVKGWHYTIRIAAGLAVAGVLRWCWPDHHLAWIAVTVVLLTERQLEWSSVKAAQRVLGTIIGVLIVGAIATFVVSGWAFTIVFALIAGLRPVARATNYLLYTAAMTPLILLMIDGGSPPDARLMVDRIVATLAAAAVVWVTSVLVRRGLE